MVNNTWYPKPTATDSSGIYEFFRYIVYLTDGLFFPVILLVIWVISFIAMLFSGSHERPSASKSWVFASFLTTVLSVPLAVIDFIARKYVYVSIVFLGIGVLWVILESSNE